MLVLTFNKKLKFDMRQRTRAEGVNSVETHTFHSMAVRYYHRRAYEEAALRAVVHGSADPLDPLPPYRLIVLDEVQDMSLLLYGFLVKLLRDYHKAHGNIPQLLVVGDENQCINKFVNSDSRCGNSC